MADTSMVDLVALIERESPTRFGKETGRNEKRTRKGACPWCGGTDRFAVFVNEIPQHYHCGIHGHGCGAHGDAITFLREYKHLGYREACEELDVDPGSECRAAIFRNQQRDDEPPSATWRTRAMEFCLTAKDTLLHSEQGQPALAWLHARGLSDATIDAAGLGLNLAQGHQSAEEWGTDDRVWIARGIVIPWHIEGHLWKVNIRRSDKDIAAENVRLQAQGKKSSASKYVCIGGGSNGLYGADTVKPGQPLLVVESEFDRLIFKQETGGRVASVATGSTTKGREEKWVKLIAQAAPVLIAFDYDSNGAGDSGFATFWRNLPNTLRYTPWSHDINDMLLQKMDINEWLQIGLQLAQIINEDGIPMICATCRQHIETDINNTFRYTPDGILYCGKHYPLKEVA